MAELSLQERTLLFYGTRLPNHPRKWWLHDRLRRTSSPRWWNARVPAPMRRYPHLRMASRELNSAFLEAQDCVLIVTDHSACDWPWIAEHAPLIVDTRNAMKSVANPRATIVRS